MGERAGSWCFVLLGAVWQVGIFDSSALLSLSATKPKQRENKLKLESRVSLHLALLAVMLKRESQAAGPGQGLLGGAAGAGTRGLCVGSQRFQWPRPLSFLRACGAPRAQPVPSALLCQPLMGANWGCLP